MDSTELNHVGETKVIGLDFGNQHCEFNEDFDNEFPEQLIEEIGITIFADSNGRHEK